MDYAHLNSSIDRITQQPLYDFEEINALIPHQDTMCFWDSVLSVDAQNITCRTQRHLDPLHPLKIKGNLSPLHLIEYGAQSIAIHGGVLNQINASKTNISQINTPNIGYLASLKNIKFGQFNPDCDFIFVESIQILADDESQVYEFNIYDEHHSMLCLGRALVMFLKSSP